MSKIGCFIHSTNMAIWKDEMLTSLIQNIQSNRLLEELDFLFISNIGDPLDEQKICGMHPKIRVQNVSSDLGLFENVTLKTMHAFSKIYPDHKLLYLHTKGVSYEKNHVFVKGILSWNQYALHCLVEQYKTCLHLLNTYDTVGCQFTKDDTNPPHYSGNFWWATSKYISSLSVYNLKQKYDAEFWLMQRKPLFYNIFSLNHMYENVWSYDGYKQLIPQRMKSNIVYCKLGFSGLGLFNQLYSLVNSMIVANSSETHTVVIVDSFLTDIQSNIYCEPDEVLDFDQMNSFLRPYNISIINKWRVQIEIVSVHFGLYDKNIVDITKIVKEQFFHGENQLIFPKGTDFNSFCVDPCCGEHKLIYVNYLLNGHEFQSVFDETVIRDRRTMILDFKYYSHVENNYYSDVWYTMISIKDFPQHRSLFDCFLKNIVFKPRFYELSQKFIFTLPPEKKINVFHLRNEIDAIEFWGSINRMSSEEYRDRLENKYISLIQKYLSKNSVTVLATMNTNNRVINFMRENGYEYMFMDKSLVKGREQNAIVDYLVSGCCTGVFIGNVNPQNFNGSTFSYGILNLLRDKDVKKVCIDTDRILDDEYVV